MKLRRLLPFSYIRSAGAVYLLLLFPNKAGRQAIGSQKRRLKLRGQYLAFKIGVTYRDSGARLKEIRDAMACYGSVLQIGFFWMFYYKDKEYRLLEKQWGRREFRPAKAGAAGGKNEWRLLSPAEALFTWVMLFSHWAVFMAANLMLFAGVVLFMLPDQIRADIMQEFVFAVDLLLSGLKYTFA